MAYPSPIQSRQSSKAIYTARRSYGKARQSTPVTDSVKAEQGRFTRRAGAASRGGEQGRTVAGEVGLSLSLKPSHSLSLSLSQTLSLNVLTKAFTELFF